MKLKTLVAALAIGLGAFGVAAQPAQGPVRRMRATASICCSPPDSRVPGLLARSCRLGNIS